MKREDATDAMMGHVRDALPVGCVAMWPDTPSTVPENIEWVRPSIHHLAGRQTTLSGDAGQRRFNRQGVLTIQCFTPIGDGHSAADKLVGDIVEYFEAIRNSPIWYRNIRAIEIGKEGSTVQVNVIADFTYEHVH